LDKLGLSFFLPHYTADFPDLILVIKLFSEPLPISTILSWVWTPELEPSLQSQ